MISEVYNIDCLEYMKGIPDKFFDLCIADPPYGINAAEMNMGNGNHIWKKKQWDKNVPNDNVFCEIFRVSKNTIIWGGNYFRLPPSRGYIYWDKGYYGKMSFSDGELAWTSFNKPLRSIKIINSNSIINDGLKIHPTQKPIALYSWILDNYANGGGKIFDPFLGSGSSRIAAYKKGFDFYACELDKDYFDAQECRFRKECFGEIKTSKGDIIKQLSLFE